MLEEKKEQQSKRDFKIEDRRFWARKATGAKKEGERPPRKSDYPSYVEQLQQQMEANREKLKQRLEELERERSSIRKRLAEDMERRLDTERKRLAVILLEVMDNLDAALDAATAEEEESQLLKGIRITRADLDARLRKRFSTRRYMRL